MEVALLHSHPSPGVKNKKIKKTNKKKKNYTTAQSAIGAECFGGPLYF